MIEAILGSAVFVAIVLALVGVVLAARAVLMPKGMVSIRVNDRLELTAPCGARLMESLVDGGVAVPAACGGSGTCGQCRVTVTKGGRPALPTEEALLSRHDIAQGVRLSCQTTLRESLSVKVPEGLLAAKAYACTVASSRTVAPLIREIVFDVPEGSEFTFTPGAFVMVEAPAHTQRFAEYTIAPEHRAAWDQMALDGLTSHTTEPVARAYSIASAIQDGTRRITLLIRLALPPPDQPQAPPGVVSSWLFGVKSGDTVQVSGPFGDFAAQDSEREMVFIGGGVGMAPLRAIISDQLERRNTKREISFWFGARSCVDLYYVEEFDQRQAKHPNFHWTAALSDPAPDDDWQGETGFIHNVVLRRYLEAHPAPHMCEYYLCGPPMMMRAVLAMLDDLGVEPDAIFSDDFGV
jgi:Na+-transporting NADH:ubiquinone oxidoreductase subunit F